MSERPCSECGAPLHTTAYHRRSAAYCAVRGCPNSGDVLLEGRWTCVEHMDHDHRPGEPFEAEGDGMGESRVPRFGRKR